MKATDATNRKPSGGPSGTAPVAAGTERSDRAAGGRTSLPGCLSQDRKPPPTARPMGTKRTDHGRRADGQGEEAGGEIRDGGLPRGYSGGILKTEQGTAKNNAGGYQSRDRHPRRASRHVTHDACPQPDAPERALAPSIALAMRPSACSACRALDEDEASLRGCEGVARRP